MTDPTPDRRKKGFERAATLMQHRIRAAGESRGFAVSKVLTHWAEIAGAEIAQKAEPVKVTYPPSGFGATLTVLTSGSYAPFLELRKEELRARVNACYGYNAVTRIQITQTAPQGFAEARARFTGPPPAAAAPDAAAQQAARAAAAAVSDPGLRAALEDMGRAVLSRAKPKERT